MDFDFTSQTDLVPKIISIFPEFEAEWGSWQGDEYPGSSPHVVYMALMPVLDRLDPSEKQIRQFADLINGAVAMGGDAENAVATCLLEHLRGRSFCKKVQPHLSKASRKRLSANFTQAIAGAMPPLR